MNTRSNADRAYEILEQQAEDAAAKAEISLEFFWSDLNYEALVPALLGLMESDACCVGCGNPFVNYRDILLTYREPPRSARDRDRLHAKNIMFLCGACHRAKGQKPFAQWLDEAEAARVSRSG
jgi:hypothetical protein